jgi:tRNA-dihydrouridine synthase C
MEAGPGTQPPPAIWLEPLPFRGGKCLPDRILPGPMEGVSEGAFVKVLSRRRLVRCWISPFIRISTGVPRQARMRERLAVYFDSGLPVVVQLMGIDARLLAGAARNAAALGAVGIDLNCACPVPRVFSNGGGGRCLERPEWIRDALLAIREAAPGVGISVKLRTGIADPAEMERILPPVREAAPDFVIIHFRTVKELYNPVSGGHGRLETARLLLPGIPLIGSGDLFSWQDAARMAAAGVDGVAPARGLIRNPWLLQEIAAACAGRPIPEVSEAAKADLFGEIADDMVDGPGTRGFILKLAAQTWGASHPLFQRLSAEPTLGKVAGILRKTAEEGLSLSE